jgi:hypothetical protein
MFENAPAKNEASRQDAVDNNRKIKEEQANIASLMSDWLKLALAATVDAPT